jgi:DUF971 family protein
MSQSDPEHITVSKSKGIHIDWKDGHASQYDLAYLRANCPCAQCTGAHGTPPLSAAPPDPFQMYKPALHMDSIEEVGSYALRIHWNDGHSTGLYSWEVFRRICPCVECKKTTA